MKKTKKTATQRVQLSNPVFGCIACIQGLPHTHEEPTEAPVRNGKLYNKGIFIRPRAIMVERMIKELFFPGIEGSICTYRKVKP